MKGYYDDIVSVTPSTMTVDMNEHVEKPSSPSTLFGAIYHLLLIVSAPLLAILLQFLASGRGNMTTSDEKKFSAARTSSSFHRRRRIQHLSTGLLFYCLSFFLSQALASIILALAIIIFYGLHIARNFVEPVQEYYMKHFGPLLREHEKDLHTLPGAFWFLVGTLIVVYSFDMNIARTSLLCLSFGDPIAAMVGIRFGGPKIFVRCNGKGSKSVIGCTACFCTCFMVAYFGMYESGLEVWLLTGVVATTMEASSCALDDNVLIPVGTGTALWLYHGGGAGYQS